MAFRARTEFDLPLTVFRIPGSLQEAEIEFMRNKSDKRWAVFLLPRPLGLLGLLGLRLLLARVCLDEEVEEKREEREDVH